MTTNENAEDPWLPLAIQMVASELNTTGIDVTRRLNSGEKLLTIAVREYQEHLIHMALQVTHLEALRIVSEAMGNPLKGDLTKSCLDLAEMAAKKLKQHERWSREGHIVIRNEI
jgi:hypothetical protein